MAALCPAALAFLKAHQSTGSLLKWCDRPLKTYGTTYWTLAQRAKSLRKLGATYMRRNRVSELDIKTMLAHSIKGETGRYAHEEPEYLLDVRQTMQRLLETLDPPWLRPYLDRDERTLTNDEAFWSMMRPQETGCWLWSGPKTPEGYGHTGHEFAHRTAYELVHGPIPTGRVVRQRCGQRACCHPDHLFLGLALDAITAIVEARHVTSISHHSHRRSRG